jgi:hypothetical protein
MRLLGAAALACLLVAHAAPGAAAEARAADPARNGAMQFSLRQESGCAARCRVLVAASGMIKPDTARDFETFAARNNIRGATLVLNSEGGSVHGAIALGRAIRRADMATTVGRLVDVAEAEAGARPVPATVMSRADCESMCAFVLLAGARRAVPEGARVRVHQIWLGDRREDAAAATYSAEDLVLVQRDIGKLAQYTIEMGGSAELLEVSLRIPPWEPMRALTREEMRRMNLDTSEAGDPHGAISPQAATAPVTSGSVGTARSQAGERGRGWTIAERTGQGGLLLTRRHPLTVEGEALGSLDLTFSCGAGANEIALLYAETRRGAEDAPAQPLKSVQVRLGSKTVALAPGAVQPGAQAGESVATASGTVTAAMLRNFGAAANRSLTIDAVNAAAGPVVIRLGNAGAMQSVVPFLASCAAGTQPDRSEQAKLQAGVN